MWFLFAILQLSTAQNTSEKYNPCYDPCLPDPKYRFCEQLFRFDAAAKRITVAQSTPHDLEDVNEDGSRRFPPFVRERQRAQEDGLDEVEFQQVLAAEAAPTEPPPRKKRQSDPAGFIWDCMDIPCICGKLPGAIMVTKLTCRLSDGSYYRKVVRKDFRLYTTAEIAAYVNGFKAVRTGIYWKLSGFHGNYSASLGAHSGPNFAGWHREFLKRLEIEIRTFRLPNGTYPYVKVALPYWDSSMDDDVYKIFGPTLGLKSYNSVWFSNTLLGSVISGQLIDGQFANWTGRDGFTMRDLDTWPGVITLFSRTDVDTIINDPVLNNILAATAGDPATCPSVPYYNLELLHGYCHVWVGGNMGIVTTATNDPIFFFHHTFIDFIWEMWRLQHQDRYQRETQWSTAALSCYASSHQKTSIMLPFMGKINQDGLSNKYTDYLYSYQLRPTCTQANKSCGGSAFLWCYLPAGRCVSRLKQGSRCSLISGVDPCYASTCSRGICRRLIIGPIGPILPIDSIRLPDISVIQ